VITITEQREVLRTVLQDISGIDTVFLRRPPAIQRVQLPAIVFYPGRATYDRAEDGARSLTIRREWAVVVYAQEMMTGRHQEAEEAVEAFLTAVPEKLAKTLRARLDDGRVFNIDLHNAGDGGVVPLRYSDTDYAGAEFRVTVTTEDYLTPTTD
jgi:hypothetical protein